MSSAICDMVEGTFSKLRMDKEQPVINLHTTHANAIRNSHKVSPSYSSRFYHGDTEFKLPVNLEMVDNVEVVDGAENCKFIKDQFSALLAKSCRCSAILGGYSESVQDLASDFARHLSLAEHVSLIVSCTIAL